MGAWYSVESVGTLGDPSLLNTTRYVSLKELEKNEHWMTEYLEAALEFDMIRWRPCYNCNVALLAYNVESKPQFIACANCYAFLGPKCNNTSV